MNENEFDLEELKKKLAGSYPAQEPVPAREIASEEPAPAAPPVPDERSLLLDKYNKFTGKSPVDQRVNTGDAINTLLGNQDAALKEAQEKSSMNRLIANLGRAGTTFADALTPLSQQKGDGGYYDNLLKQAQQPVENLRDKQKLIAQTLENNIIKNQLINKTDRNDSNSGISKATQQVFGESVKQAGMDISKFGDISRLSAESLDNILPGVEKIGNNRFNKQQLAVQRADKLDQKRTDQQNKALTDATTKINTFRGNQAAQQASGNVLSGKKAVDLIDMPGMKTTQDLRLIAEELGKIASGGVPGEHGTQALMPSNLKTKYAEMVNFMSSSPTNAQADEYLKRNRQYLQSMVKTASDNLQDYQLAIAKGYRHILRPEDYSELQKDVKARYESNLIPNQPAAMNKEDEEAVKWANANKADPRAQQILKLHGML